MNDSEHPSRQELRAFAIGSVDEPTAQRLIAHLTNCGLCESTLRELEQTDDTVLRHLRNLIAPAATGPATATALTAASPPAAVRLEPGVPHLAGYQLLEKLGEGGMGAVHKARHLRLKRTVAIKFLTLGRRHDSAAVARFQREMEALGELNHPHIVQAYDAGEAEGTPYLVMEFVDGCDLAHCAHVLGPLPVPDACEAIRQAALGLQYAHERHLVHRDVKPSNLMLSSEGQVKVLDLGLARISTAAGELTSTNAVMGTLDYMAPEQANDSSAVDIRADVYGLGAALYKLLGGKPPFGGARNKTPLEKLSSLANDQPQPLNQRRSGLAAELVKIVHRALAKRPSDRQATPGELAAALAPFTAGCDLKRLLATAKSAEATGGAALQSTIVTHSVAEASKSPERPVPSSLSAISGGLFALALLLTAMVFFVQTRVGTIRVEINDPDIEVSIQGTDIVLKQADQGKDVKLSPGDKTLVVKRGKLIFETGKLVLKKGDTVTVQVELLAGQLEVKQGDTVLGQAKLPPPPVAKAPFDAAQAKAHQDAWAKYLGTRVETTNSVGAKLALIPPGEFLMGSSDEEVILALKIAEETKLDSAGVGRIQEERSQHRVRITRPFRLAIHEVTIGQFGTFIEQSGYKTPAEEFGGNSDITQADDPRIKPEQVKLNWRTPGLEVEENSPVTQVSWNDAVAFCNWLSVEERLTPSYVRDGNSWMLVAQPRGYRLPTEAEWEYACRAGTTTQYSFGDDWKELENFGWSNTNAGGRPRGVGLLRANPFDLYDMHGNVWEWCHDGYDSKRYERSPLDDPRGLNGALTRVFRGGSWYPTSAYGRSSSRNFATPATRNDYCGFRIAL